MDWFRMTVGIFGGIALVYGTVLNYQGFHTPNRSESYVYFTCGTMGLVVGLGITALTYAARNYERDLREALEAQAARDPDDRGPNDDDLEPNENDLEPNHVPNHAPNHVPNRVPPQLPPQLPPLPPQEQNHGHLHAE